MTDDVHSAKRKAAAAAGSKTGSSKNNGGGGGGGDAEEEEEAGSRQEDPNRFNDFEALLPTTKGRTTTPDRDACSVVARQRGQKSKPFVDGGGGGCPRCLRHAASSASSLPFLPRTMMILVSLVIIAFVGIVCNSFIGRDCDGRGGASCRGAKAGGSVVGPGGEQAAAFVSYDCPATVGESANDKSDSFELYLEEDNATSSVTDHPGNLTLDEIKSAAFDAWYTDYGQLKELFRPWKTEVFVSNVRPGDSIYESACGRGLNLLLTVEILGEHSVYPVTVYGNDYVEASVEWANRVWETRGASEVARRGTFCAGDSSNLGFVPSSSFDFVYTGYIDPIVDPGNIFLPANATIDDKWAANVEACRSDNSTDKKMAEMGQSAQEDWYAGWVTEMIRIAKPGKVIAAETNAVSLCRDMDDWGGVDKEWWRGAVSKYGWDVDPDSVIIRDMPKEFENRRYHVMMRRNL